MDWLCHLANQYSRNYRCGICCAGLQFRDWIFIMTLYRILESQVAREMGDMGYTKPEIDLYLDQRAAAYDEAKYMADDSDFSGDIDDE